MGTQLIRKMGRQFQVIERQDLFWRNVSRNKWENRTFRIFQQFVGPKTVYLDIGAWIGPTVLFAASVAARCVAVEPDPVAYAELKLNVGLNPGLAGKVTIFNGCIARNSGQVQFGSQSIFGDSQSSLLFAGGAHSVEVEALSFQDFLKRYEIRDCGFIKMDIEGGESMVLPTMKRFLTEQQPTLYLSLHQKWFANKTADIQGIADVLRVYPFVYEADGRVLDRDGLDGFLASGEMAEVVAMAKPWPVIGRFRHQILGA